MAAIVFIHNHPSGDPRPSAEDFVTTKRLADCGELLGIRVVDHLVIGDGRYVSMRAMGKIKMRWQIMGFFLKQKIWVLILGQQTL